MDSSDNDMSITEQAHEWFVSLPHATPQERTVFAKWLKTSPRHVGEFLMVTAVHRHYSNLDPEHRIDVDALLAEEQPNVVSLPMPHLGPNGSEVRESPAPRWKWAVGVTAAGALAIAGLQHWRNVEPVVEWTAYETLTGQSKTVTFSDGSLAHLNTQSRMEVKYESESRQIRLLAGEVLFDVKQNPHRPFRVHSGSASIQALGTQFDVYRQARSTKVSVLEGQIQIATQDPGRQLVKLEKGEAADVAADGYITPLAASEGARLTAWRDNNKLIFRGEKLTSVIAEFNRYNRSPKFRIDDTTAGERRISGVFKADAPESFVRVLRGLSDLLIERTTDEVIIRQK